MLPNIHLINKIIAAFNKQMEADIPEHFRVKFSYVVVNQNTIKLYATACSEYEDFIKYMIESINFHIKKYLKTTNNFDIIILNKLIKVKSTF